MKKPTPLKKMLAFVLFIGLMAVGFPLLDLIGAQTSFSNLDLNSSDGLLFTSSTESRSVPSHDNLYQVQIGTKKGQAALETPKILTCFPENIEVLSGGKQIYVTNGHGNAVFNRTTGSLAWENSTPGLFAVPRLREAVSISPDGNWLCRFDKKTAASGDVVLEEVRTKKTLVLAENAEYSYTELPVLWSPDSTVLVYEKDGTLYFLKTSDAFGTSRLAEDFRKIGPGLIKNAFWASEKLLVYIYHDLVYTIGTSELHTRSMYSDLLGIGKIAGRMVSPFDSKKDQFWTNAQCTAMVLVQDNRTLWYMELNGNNDFSFVTTLFSYPFVHVSGSAIKFHVFWTPDVRTGPLKAEQLPIVWVELLRGGQKESYVYKLAVNDEQHNTYFTSLAVPPFVSAPQVSADGKTIAFMDDKCVHVYDLLRWTQTADYSAESIVCFRWLSRTELVIGGDESVRVWNYRTDAKTVLFLSQAKRFAWDGGSGKIIVQAAGEYWSYNATTNAWDKSAVAITRKAVTQNGYYRVFLGDSRNITYRNAIFVRTLSGMSETRPLTTEFTERATSKPKAALVIDALDNADGLTTILNTLDRYNLRVTFVLNGEFIRRFPNGIREIVAAGHECASMFSSSSTLTNTAFITDENYIRSGLARNEDEFFAVTGGELTLFWHAPLYQTTREISLYAKNAGYHEIKVTVPVLDQTTLEDTARRGSEYYSSSRIIEAMVGLLKDGAVIPVSVGLSSGTRSDYLYNSLDVLVSGILDAGYDIVKVSDL